MSFLKRLLSVDYRRALTAEAAGDYHAAAQRYALADEPHKVAEMHLCAADGAGGVEERLRELRIAARWAEGGAPVEQAVQRRIARAMLQLVRAHGVLSGDDLALLRQAAHLFERVGDAADAGECQELCGDVDRAAQSFQRAGEVDRLEQILTRDEQQRQVERRLVDQFADYQSQLLRGDRARALRALQTCVELAPRREYRVLLAELEGRWLSAGTVAVRVEGREIRYLERFPLRIGRAPSCELNLRDPGISRYHATIETGEGSLLLRDEGSRNGTRWSGRRLTAPEALTGEGELAIGDHCVLQFSIAGDRLLLEVVRGLDQGRRIYATTARSFALIGGVFELSFREGLPHVTAAGEMRLNGATAAGTILLLRGDRVACGDAQFEVID